MSDGQANERQENQPGGGAGTQTNGAATPDLESIVAERDSYLDQLQRSRADFANFRRRTDQERQQARELANRVLIAKLLPVVDDFQRALEAVPADKREMPWITGLTMIERKLWDILEKEGLQPIAALGEPFDPSVHEAIATDPDNPGNIVVDVFQTGYRLGDGVLRPAMVRVGAPPPDFAGKAAPKPGAQGTPKHHSHRRPAGQNETPHS